MSLYLKPEIYFNSVDIPTTKKNGMKLYERAVRAELILSSLMFYSVGDCFQVRYTFSDGSTDTLNVPQVFLKNFIPYLVDGVYEGELVPVAIKPTNMATGLVPIVNAIETPDVIENKVYTVALDKMEAGEIYELPSGRLVMYLMSNIFVTDRGYMAGCWFGYGLPKAPNDIKSFDSRFIDFKRYESRAVSPRIRVAKKSPVDVVDPTSLISLFKSLYKPT